MSEQQQTLANQQALDLAVQHHNAGRLPEAENIYQQILQTDPNQPIALHLLGVVAYQMGKNELAVDGITKALAIQPDLAEGHNNLGLVLQALEKPQEAIASYQKALALKPDYAEPHYNLGVTFQKLGKLDDALVSHQKALDIRPDYAAAHFNVGNLFQELGKLDDAANSYRRALATKPDFVEVHNNLGTTLQGVGKPDDAAASYRKALALNPDYAEAHNNLGAALWELRKLDDAMASYQKALDLKPDYAEAHYNLGTALKDLGKLEEAVASYHKALDLKPDYAEAHNSLGLALRDHGELADSLASYHKALAIKPDYPEAHNNLGNALQDLGELEEAAASYRKALRLNPKHAMVHYNLGNALRDLGELEDSLASYHKALAIKPDFAEAHDNLGHVLKDLGKLEEAVSSYHKALAIKPDFAEAHSNLLLTEQYRPNHNTKTLYELHREWDERHGRVFRAAWPQYQNVPDIDRRLRIGFVSPDLGRHPVGYFTVGLLENLPKTEIETFVYSDRRADDLTERIKDATAVWRSIYGLPDEKLTKTILNDEIDILIELSGHSAKNRLLVFARKPAPLQVTWAGYAGTTGLSAIDYLLSDIYSTHEDEERFYSENIIRMPDGWLCYEPPDYAPKIGPLPFTRNGIVTFGSFSNRAKLNAQVVSVWARILDKVEHSRLLIKYEAIDSVTNADHLTAMFEAEGINRSRLNFEGRSTHAELLARYNDVEIALDPFPYSGGLTTLEALWMGVPVITVPGETFASRHSLSHLSTIGLTELVARDQDNYVELAVGLANDTDRLAQLRASLREQMACSPTCDSKIFADFFTSIMRNIWRDWCLSQNAE